MLGRYAFKPTENKVYLHLNFIVFKKQTNMSNHFPWLHNCNTQCPKERLSQILRVQKTSTFRIKTWLVPVWSNLTFIIS